MGARDCSKGETMTNDSFDFTGLKTNPPSGLRVLDAGIRFFRAVRETKDKTTYFWIFKHDGFFELHSTNPQMQQIGADLHGLNESTLIFRNEELGRLLYLIGYKSRPTTPQPLKLEGGKDEPT